MGLREWAIKPGELKLLSRPGLLLFSARCALRVEPWRVEGGKDLWNESLALVVERAFAAPDDTMPAADVNARGRAVSSVGARECNRLETIDEPLGRCRNYAHTALAEAVCATALVDRKALVKATIDCAKQSASIAAVWAHAGRVPVPSGREAVEVACATVWAAIRADIAPLVAGATGLAAARNRLMALRDIAPLWPGHQPSWAAPS